MFKRVCQTVGNIKEHRISKRNYLRKSLEQNTLCATAFTKEQHTNLPKNNSTTDIWKKDDLSKVNPTVNGEHNEQKETILD